MNDEIGKIVYTTAPEAYDGFSTMTVDPQVGQDRHGRMIRMVTMDERDANWQTSRYRSGLYAVCSEQEATELFAALLWTSKEDLCPKP